MALKWTDVPGWTNCMDLYDEVALTTPPYSTVVEVGVCFGRSLLYLAQRIKETGKQIQVVAVDRWEPYPEHRFIYTPGAAANESEEQAYEYAARYNGTYGAFIHAVHASGLADIINIVRADSVDAARLFARKPPHFVFIDAEHTYNAVKADLDGWWSCGANGSGPEWMAGDDYNPGSEVDFPGVWKAVHEKFGAENVGQRQTTSWVVRRSHLERPAKPVADRDAQVLEAMRPWQERP